MSIACLPWHPDPHPLFYSLVFTNILIRVLSVTHILQASRSRIFKYSKGSKSYKDPKSSKISESSEDSTNSAIGHNHE